MILTRLLRLFVVITLAAPSWAATPTAGFALPDRKGKIHRLDDYKGKWVLVNYWATWCPPCLEEIPELEVFHTNSDGKAVVLGVNMEDVERTRLDAFLDEQFVSYPILLAGANPEASQRLGSIPGLPTSFLISPQGRVVARQVGPITADAIRKFIANYRVPDKKNR